MRSSTNEGRELLLECPLSQSVKSFVPPAAAKPPTNINIKHANCLQTRSVILELEQLMIAAPKALHLNLQHLTLCDWQNSDQHTAKYMSPINICSWCLRANHIFQVCNNQPISLSKIAGYTETAMINDGVQQCHLLKPPCSFGSS
jgi:hypothetical protein